MADAPRAAEVAAPAKFNPRLRVLAREEDGHHALETLFCALSLADDVRVEPGEPGIALDVEGEDGEAVDVGPPERNLAVRAARRFVAAVGEKAALRLRLRKRIPAAAGLGGGSSDAAAVLRALNALHGGPLSRGELLQIAIELGSDVPFFLCGSTLALGWSRGERLLALPPLPARPALVAHPGAAHPTPEAFARLSARRGPYRLRAHVFHPDTLGSWEAVAAVSGNDFEPDAVEAHPVLRDALAAMHGAGATLAMLAGSGASLVGVYPDAGARDVAAGRVEGLGLRVWRAETLAEEPAVRVDRSAGET